MSREPRLYLADIVTACRKIQRLAATVDDERLFSDETVRDAILFNIVVIGEAAARTPLDVQGAWPEVPWARMKAMRNIVAHQYFGLDRGLVLDVVRKKVPDLLRALEPAAGPG
jgi:uncharacterized protein with HEPN domain